MPTLHAAEYICDRSGSKTTPSPDGKWVANVQEEVCDTPTGAAAGITVVLALATDPQHSRRVFIMPVPRSRDDWPRIRWDGPDAVELRVANLSEAPAPEPMYEGIRISLVHCNDNPEDRARLVAYKAAVLQWQQVVSAWRKSASRMPMLRARAHRGRKNRPSHRAAAAETEDVPATRHLHDAVFLAGLRSCHSTTGPHRHLDHAIGWQGWRCTQWCWRFRRHSALHRTREAQGSPSIAHWSTPPETPPVRIALRAACPSQYSWAAAIRWNSCSAPNS